MLFRSNFFLYDLRDVLALLVTKMTLFSTYQQSISEFSKTVRSTKPDEQTFRSQKLQELARAVDERIASPQDTVAVEQPVIVFVEQLGVFFRRMQPAGSALGWTR